MTRQVRLCDNNDQKVYLPSWMSKRDCYQMYYLDQGYHLKDNNCGNIVHTWIGPPEENPQLKTVSSWKGISDYWEKHHN